MRRQTEILKKRYESWKLVWSNPFFPAAGKNYGALMASQIEGEWSSSGPGTSVAALIFKLGIPPKRE